MGPRRFECFVEVVDDDEPVRRALARLIRSLGFEAEVFSSGEEFLAALPTRRPDCVVLDLNMPGVDGFEVQTRMAEARVRVPVIVITGHDSPEAKARALGGGAVVYLQKPLEAGVLRDAIRTAVLGSPRNGGSTVKRRIT
jgi:FixJ family two-component response regulator